MNESHNGNGRGHWKPNGEYAIQTELDPVILAQLQELEGKMVQGLALWSDSIADEELGEEVPEEERVFVDFDLYLEDQNLLEVYAATVYRDVNDEPLTGFDEIASALGEITEHGAILSEVTTDEEDGLVLVFATEDNEAIIVAPSGWAIGHWDELPEEEEE